MAPLDLSRLAPSDASTALRSYARRYRSAAAPVKNDEDVEELAFRLGPDGRSAVEIISDVTRSWVVLHEGVRQITISDTPVLHPAVVDPAQRQWEAPPPASLDEALTLLADEATAFAEEIDHVPSTGWARSGSVAGGETVTALDVVKQAVLVGHDGLDEVERTLRAVRS